MGTISINITSEVLETPALNKIASQVLSVSACARSWIFKAKTPTTAWIEFTIPANVLITQTIPSASFVNGITIDSATPEWRWEFTVDAFVSLNEVLNTQLTTVVARLYDVQGGTLLDTETIDLYHSQLVC